MKTASKETITKCKEVNKAANLEIKKAVAMIKEMQCTGRGKRALASQMRKLRKHQEAIGTAMRALAPTKKP